MKTVRIGLDLDGVIVDWGSNVIRLLNERKGYNIPMQEWPEWNWLEHNIKPEDWKWIWSHEGVLVEGYATAKPFDGAHKFAKALRALGDIVILTSRPEGTWTASIKWWKQHMFFTPAGYNFFRSGKEKSAVWCHYFVEDNLDNAKSYAANGFTHVFLLDKKYNQGDTGVGVERVFSYDEIIERIKSETSE